MTIDLNKWHHDVHQVSRGMALKFNKATAADLERWAKALRGIASEMEAVCEDEMAEPALGEPIDATEHAQAVGVMVRVASRLSVKRRARDITELSLIRGGITIERDLPAETRLWLTGWTKTITGGEFVSLTVEIADEGARPSR